MQISLDCQHRELVSHGPTPDVDIKSDRVKLNPNLQHFSAMVTTHTLPTPIGAMYKYYLKQYQKLIHQND